MATLTYVYADSTAVLGPLATYAEPHCYDLCDIHSERLTAPRGWEVVRISPDPESLRPTSDDLEALADAVREAARPRFHQHEADGDGPTVEVARRGHLRMLASTVTEPTQTQPPTAAPSVEPNWRLSDDDELDELFDDDDDVDSVLGAQQEGSSGGDLEGDVALDEVDDFSDFGGDETVDTDAVPADQSDRRARVLNLPIRSLGDEREPS